MFPTFDRSPVLFTFPTTLVGFGFPGRPRKHLDSTMQVGVNRIGSILEYFRARSTACNETDASRERSRVGYTHWVGQPSFD
jgi:hypothetical protein